MHDQLESLRLELLCMVEDAYIESSGDALHLHVHVDQDENGHSFTSYSDNRAAV